jgi:hypothetical protein
VLLNRRRRCIHLAHFNLDISIFFVQFALSLDISC